MVAVQSVPIPDRNRTVPLAAAGSPDAVSVIGTPYATDVGDVVSVNDGVAFVTLKLAPVAVVPL